MRRRGTSIVTRVERIERRLPTGESWQERQNQAMLTSWLAESEDGVEHWLDHLDAVDASSCQRAVVQEQNGRQILLAVVESLFLIK
jgi:hypothetical protein